MNIQVLIPESQDVVTIVISVDSDEEKLTNITIAAILKNIVVDLEATE